MRNTQSFITLTRAEALALWKQLLHLEPVRRDCEVEREDGIDLDALLSRHIGLWYAELLLTAPAHLLPVEDFRSAVSLVAGDGVVEATVPPRAVRPVEWQLRGWSHSVTRFLSPDDPARRRHLNRWTRGGSCRPAIVDLGDRLLLYGPPVDGSTPVVAMAHCVAQPAGDNIVLHTALIDSITAYARDHDLPQYF